MSKKLTLILIALLATFTCAFAQSKRVKGQVLDEAGLPAIGATVVLKGDAAVGTVTDLDGKYVLENIPDSKGQQQYIQVLYMGYKTKEVPLSDNLTIRLELDSEVMDAAVVTGMTTLDKRLFTGSADQLNAEDVMIGGISDVSRSLEGRSAGVSVQNVSATFGTAPKIRVRGATSILGNSKPLWVVDGVIIEDVTEVGADELSSGDAVTMISSAIAGLNSDDIESINILKDGSATSIYGAKAMAGVIVVTTKKGRAGSAKLTYMGEFTTRMKPSYNQYNIMNSQDQMGVYRELQDKGYFNFAETIRSREYGVYGKMYNLINTYDLSSGQFGMPYTEAAMNNYLRAAEYRNTDWFDELFSNSVMMNHSLSFSGGTKYSNSYVSLSLMNDPGWYERSKVTRYTFNANTTFKILDNLSISVLGNGSYRKQEAPGTLGLDADAVLGEVKRDFDINPFSYAMNTSRTMSSDEDYVRNYTSFNIFDELQNNYIDMDAADLRFQAELKWDIIPGLTFQSLASYRYNQTSMQHHIQDDSNQARAYREMSDATVQAANPYLYSDPDQLNTLPVTILPKGGIYEKREYKSPSYTIRETLTWNKTFKESHILNLYSGMEITSVKRTNDWFRGWGMQYNKGEKAFFNYLAFKRSAEDNADYFTLSNTLRRSVAFFGMLNYSYKGRYSVNGTIRYEGTNRLGRDRQSRWLPTWNVGASWNIHDEPWFRNLSAHAITNLTLKASYSLTADAGPDWISNATVIYNSYNTAYRPTADDKESGLAISMLGNRELTYEKKHEINVGIAAGFVGNRINIEADVYKRDNFDLLGLVNTQGIGGEIWKYANMANMESKGVEFTLSTRNIAAKDFKWTTDLTFSWSEQTITNLKSDANIMSLIQGSGYNLEGYSPSSLFSIPFKGLDKEGFPVFELNGVTYDKRNAGGISFQESSEEALNSLKYEGPTDPVFTGGFGNIFTYKGFRLNIFMTYGFGNVARMTPIYKSDYSDFYAMYNDFKNRWMVPGDEHRTNVPVIASKRQKAEYGGYNVQLAYNAYNYSSVRVAKADFIRMKEISLTYEFPKKWISRAKLENMSLKFSATNPFLIYAHKSLNGQDPEYSNVGGVSSPLARQFTFTLKFGFDKR